MNCQPPIYPEGADLASLVKQHYVMQPDDPEAQGIVYGLKRGRFYDDWGDKWNGEVPAQTVITPVALGSEPSEGVADTLWAIHDDSKHGATELVLWCNDAHSEYKEANKGVAAVRAERTRNLGRLIRHIDDQGFDTDRLRASVSVDYYMHHVDMLRVRDRAGSAVLYDGVARGFPADHPVFWVDADTPYIADGALGEMRWAVAEEKLAPLVRAGVEYVGNPHDDRPETERSQAERVALVYAKWESSLNRLLGPYATRPYLNECGVGFTLGTWAVLDGLRAQDVPLSTHEVAESRLLEIKLLQKIGKGAVTGSGIYHHLPARIGTSYRHMEECATYMPDLRYLATEDIHTSYTLFAGRKRTKAPFNGTRTAKDLEDMVVEMLVTWRHFANDASGLLRGEAFDAERRKITEYIRSLGFE